MDDSKLSFGPYVLDLAGEKLLHRGHPVRLRAKTQALLRSLATRPGELVTREQLQQEIWPGVAISPDTLSDCVRELRRALGQRPGTAPRHVETVRGRGYRFITPVVGATRGTHESWDETGVRIRLPASDRARAEAAVRRAAAPALASAIGHGAEEVAHAYRGAERAAREHGDTQDVCAALWGKTTVAMIRGELADARLHGQALLRAAALGSEVGYRMMALDSLTAQAFFSADLAGCEQHARELLAGYDPRDHTHLLDAERIDLGVDAAGYLALAAGLRGWSAGNDAARDYAARSSSVAGLGPRVQFHALGALVHLVTGDRAAAAQEAMHGIAVGTGPAVAPWDTMARFVACAAKPATVDGIGDIQASLEGLTGRLMGRSLFMLLAADAALQRGYRQEALDWAEVALLDALARDERIAVAGLMALRRSIAPSHGDRPELAYSLDPQLTSFAAVRFGTSPRSGS